MTHIQKSAFESILGKGEIVHKDQIINLGFVSTVYQSYISKFPCFILIHPDVFVSDESKIAVYGKRMIRRRMNFRYSTETNAMYSS